VHLVVTLAPLTGVNFDEIVDRRHTDSVKWDGRIAMFGRDDVLPLWVADSDFAVAPPIQQALVRRAMHPIYGYSQAADDLLPLVMSWQKERHGWHIQPDCLATVPAVVPTLYAAVRSLTQPGDAVIVQPPVYTPFFNAVTDNNRRLLLNPLKQVLGYYQIDFEQLEECAKQGAKLMLLCSPHNPIGRVWSRAELLTLLDMARRYDITLVCDEIHADLVYQQHKHHPLLSLAESSDKLISVFSPSKTFNMPGLSMAFMVATDALLRERVVAEFKGLHIESNHPFSLTAVQAAYAQGAPWLDAMMLYLAQTQQQVVDFVEHRLPKVSVRASEATFLMWLDFNELGLDDQALQRLLIQQAKVGLSAGDRYGQGGEGFMRLNIAAPSALVMQALQQIEQALAKAL